MIQFNLELFSLDSITSALQTAARLSKQAELGGIIEEIEVSSHFQQVVLCHCSLYIQSLVF